MVLKYKALITLAFLLTQVMYVQIILNSNLWDLNSRHTTITTSKKKTYKSLSYRVKELTQIILTHTINEYKYKINKFMETSNFTQAYLCSSPC